MTRLKLVARRALDRVFHRGASGRSLFRHAGVNARTDSPSIAELVEKGWTVEHRNQWGGALMKKGGRL